jgi:hypothetical protein
MKKKEETTDYPSRQAATKTFSREDTRRDAKKKQKN